MTELKTLKDMTVWNPKPRRFYFDEKTQVMTSKPFDTIDKIELRQEAIKWIAHLKTEAGRPDDQAINFIKHFFNITDEDLIVFERRENKHGKIDICEF